MVAVGVLAYGVLELVEAVGLWMMKRWGEYVAVVGTGIFIPLEIYEIVETVTWLRIVALALNVFAVVYILWTKTAVRDPRRQGGVRGESGRTCRCWRSSGPRSSATRRRARAAARSDRQAPRRS